MGKKARRREIRSMLIKCNVGVCCIQETKMEKLGDRICISLWKDKVCDWAYKEAEERSGGCLQSGMRMFSTKQVLGIQGGTGGEQVSENRWHSMLHTERIRSLPTEREKGIVGSNLWSNRTDA